MGRSERSGRRITRHKRLTLKCSLRLHFVCVVPIRRYPAEGCWEVDCLLHPTRRFGPAWGPALRAPIYLDCNGDIDAADVQQAVRQWRLCYWVTWSSTSGGCQPTLTQRRRASTMTALFMFNATTVARPTAVKLIRCVAEASQAK
jgi:hypothetical protein